VPKRLNLGAKYSKHLVSRLRIGAQYFCYLDELYVGEALDGNCSSPANVPAYSTFLYAGQGVELELVDGYGSVYAQIYGEVLP
jgi:hypothetical protein